MRSQLRVWCSWAYQTSRVECSQMAHMTQAKTQMVFLATTFFWDCLKVYLYLISLKQKLCFESRNDICWRGMLFLNSHSWTWDFAAGIVFVGNWSTLFFCILRSISNDFTNVSADYLPVFPDWFWQKHISRDWSDLLMWSRLYFSRKSIVYITHCFFAAFGRTSFIWDLGFPMLCLEQM